VHKWWWLSRFPLLPLPYSPTSPLLKSFEEATQYGYLSENCELYSRKKTSEENVRSQLEANESEHGELVLPAVVLWLSKGVFWQSFRDLLNEVQQFWYQERRCLFNTVIMNDW
jgi:hypothetical protein